MIVWLKKSLARLKTLKTMTERIDHVIYEASGLYDRMERLDPGFMAPIERGLERRDALLDKKLRAIERINQRRTKNHPQNER